MIRLAADRALGRRSAPRRRGRSALAAALLLAGCASDGGGGIRFAAAPPLAPAAQAAVMPHFADGFFVAEDGARLPLRQWLPAGNARAVILALHGFGDYSHAFAIPAPLWAKRGIATYAFDQRGFGAAPGHGQWAGEARLAADAIEAGGILRRLYPGRPLYLLGESMGGAVAILVMSGAWQGVGQGAGHGVAGDPAPPAVAAADGLILSAPAVWGRATMALIPRLALFAATRLFPDMVLTGRDLHIMASDNIPMLRALARDPLVLKGARVETVYGLVNLMDDALAAAPRLAVPTLLMYGAHDQVVPRAPIADFVAQLPAAAVRRDRLAYYPNGYHMLLRDLDGARVANDVASWILDPAAPLPSDADAANAVRPWPPLPEAAQNAARAPPSAAVASDPRPGLAPPAARR
jgi:alpha-beta hydrolase superfamily lysophospholipase